MARVKRRYWRPGWKADLQNAAGSCRACHFSKQRQTRRQAKMVKWHPLARFHTVAMDTTDKSPASVRGHKKLFVIENIFIRCVIAIPITDEIAFTIATILFDRRISVRSSGGSKVKTHKAFLPPLYLEGRARSYVLIITIHTGSSKIPRVRTFAACQTSPQVLADLSGMGVTACS
jgi:hypothetical protein